jgi:hypothetical protein
VTSPFQLSGTAILHLFIGCDYPTVFRSPEAADNDEVPPTSVRAALLKNGAEISRDAWYMPAPPVCAPGDVIEVELELPTGDTEFDAEDTFTLEIPVFSSNPYQAADNVHILVASTETPWALHAVGLPVSGGAGAMESLAVVAESDTVAVEAGSTERLAFSVRNDGAEDAEFNVSAVSVPDGLSVSFDPSSGSVAANASAEVTMAVSADADAQAGEHAFQVRVEGPSGGNSTWNVTVNVEEPRPSGGGSPSPSPSPAEANPTPDTNATDLGNATDTDGGSAPGVSAVMPTFALVAAVVGSLAVRRRE